SSTGRSDPTMPAASSRSATTMLLITPMDRFPFSIDHPSAQRLDRAAPVLAFEAFLLRAARTGGRLRKENDPWE
ncbi:MAG: hypothetical protein K8F32_10015, partial [Rhodocyclaceae bacterium]|nr:hypothetical protein [Rhodocyclaceae bacterium]